jgi:hypothetical protein
MSSDTNANWTFNTIGDNQGNSYTIKNSGGLGFGFASLAYAQGVKAGSTTVTMNVTALSGTVSMRYVIIELPGSTIAPVYVPYDVLEFRGSMFVCVAETNVDPFTSMTGWALLAQGTGGADALTGAYTAVAADYARLKTNSTGGSITVKLPATPPLNPDGTATWWMAVQATVSAIVVNPNGLDLDGSASNLTVPAGQGLLIFTDGANYFSMTGLPQAINLAASGPGGVTGILPVANGGTGTSTPALIAGSNVTITGSWPNQTINSTGGGGGTDATAIQSIAVSATAPKDQQVLRYIAANSDWEPSNDEAFIPNRRWMSTITANGTSTTLSASGDSPTLTGSGSAFGPAGGTAPRNAIVNVFASTGANYGYSGLANYRGDHNFAALLICCLNNGSLLTQRCWCGLTDQTLATMNGSANPAGNYAAFRFDTSAGDTVFQCITKDGTTQNIISSGVTPVVGRSFRFSIVYNNTLSKVYFYIDTVLVATSSAHLPSATANLLFVISAVASAGSGSLNFETVVIEQDF